MREHAAHAASPCGIIHVWGSLARFIVGRIRNKNLSRRVWWSYVRKRKGSQIKVGDSVFLNSIRRQGGFPRCARSGISSTACSLFASRCRSTCGRVRRARRRRGAPGRWQAGCPPWFPRKARGGIPPAHILPWPAPFAHPWSRPARLAPGRPHHADSG